MDYLYDGFYGGSSVSSSSRPRINRPTGGFGVSRGIGVSRGFGVSRSVGVSRGFGVSRSFPRPLSNRTVASNVITHPNPKAIEFESKHTSIKTTWKKSEDEFKTPLLSVSGSYNFTTKVLTIKVSPMYFGKVQVSSIEMCCHAKKIYPETFSAETYTVLLSDRHVFDTKFKMELKYILIDHRGTANFTSKFNFEIPYFQTKTLLKFDMLDQYHPSEEITKIFHKESDNDHLYSYLASYGRETSSSFESYKALPFFGKLEKAVSFEDLAARDAIKHLSHSYVMIQGSQNNYFFRTKNTKAIKAERWREMSLFLIPMELHRQTYNKPENCTFVQIDDIQNDYVKIDTKKFLDKSISYHVDFIPNRIGIRACLKALAVMKVNQLGSFFLNIGRESYMSNYDMMSNLSSKFSRMKQTTFEFFEWFNESIANNYEQTLAIRNIVNSTGGPYPQVVFGPPGTGKTSTLVECVAQIVKLRPDCRVLIATQSNSASDEIGVRLIKFVPINKVYRFYSPSKLSPASGGPNPELKFSSNLRDKRNEWPTKEEICHFNVVISTLITSSRLGQSDINAEHFDYIFVDEISCATEPEALVPIIGLGTKPGEITSNVVLLGDHLQLGPVLESEEFSQVLGLGVSFMERLMACPRYSKNGTYNQRHVVQLLDNYRSHPAILKFSSDQFYEGRLRPKMSACDQSLTETWSFLPNKTFPIIFHAVETPSQLDGTSSYNVGEVNVVVSYVQKLLATKWGVKKLEELDIGIISPYLAQLKKLKEAIKYRWPNIEMGTAEYFQGREKRVIIISTVKSKGGVGFLSNEKRCNVILTRAKSFEVVIGNPDTLKKDPFWRAFVEYCENNRSLVRDSVDLLGLNFGQMKV